MRVISGKARGKKLVSLEGMNTRPTLDRVKEALFNIIQFDIPGKRVLDLFAGSGALGIEAISRGAEKATFCDNSIDAIQVIKTKVIQTMILANKMKLSLIVILMRLHQETTLIQLKQNLERYLKRKQVLTSILSTSQEMLTRRLEQ